MEPQKQFRGNFIRPEIFELVDEEQITIREAWLLMVVDNLVKYGGKDCFASNAYLAVRIQTKEDRVSKIITKLKRLGLLIQTDFDGRKRLLRTYWSCIETRSKPSGRLGSKTYHREVLRTSNKNNTPAEKVSAGKSGKKKKLHDRWIVFSERLSNAISQVRQIKITSAKIQNSANEIRKLHSKEDIPIPRIRKTLNWYCQTITEEGDLIRENTNFIPIAYSGRSFRNKFLRIEDAMKRLPTATTDETELTDSQMKQHESFTDVLQDFGIKAKDTELFIQKMSIYRRKVSDSCQGIKESAELAVEKELAKNDGEVWSTTQKPIYDADAVFEQILPQLGEQYHIWMARQITRWKENWSGKLDQFHPGGRHFTRYMTRIMDECNRGWGGEFKGILLETKEG